MSSRILLWSALWAALFGALVALALFQIHYAGQPQSYDTLLYSRGLWGVAHGNWHNPIFDLETFAIHGSFVFFLLAPLAHIMSSANVLIAAQAVSLAGVVFVTVREAGRVVAVTAWRVPRIYTGGRWGSRGCQLPITSAPGPAMPILTVQYVGILALINL